MCNFAERCNFWFFVDFEVIFMKKFVAVMIFAFVAAFSVSICSAYHPHDYYDGDPYYYDSNYKYIHGGNDYSSYYLDLSSIDVQEYNPPHYQIAATIVGYGGYFHKVYKPFDTVIRYNWYTKETYYQNDYGNWIKRKTEGTDNISINARRMADALFRAAYKMDFYGY